MKSCAADDLTALLKYLGVLFWIASLRTLRNLHFTVNQVKLTQLYPNLDHPNP